MIYRCVFSTGSRELVVDNISANDAVAAAKIGLKKLVIQQPRHFYHLVSVKPDFEALMKEPNI